MQHVKPHGAMYNMAAKDEKLAIAIAEGIAEVDDSLILLGLSGSEMLKAAERIGLKSKKEVFADRAYEEDGTLVARTKPGSMITDENLAIERVLKMIKNGSVKAVTGKEISNRSRFNLCPWRQPESLSFVKKSGWLLGQKELNCAPWESKRSL